MLTRIRRAELRKELIWNGQIVVEEAILLAAPVGHLGHLGYKTDT